MKVPEKFPPGCSFVPTFGGDEFVKFPDGNWFKFSDDGNELSPCPLMKAGPSDGITVREDAPPRLA